MKKLIAILLAASMLFVFAACSGKEEPETTAPVETTMEDIFAEPETDAPVEGETAAPVEGETAAPVEGETAAPAADMDKAAFVAFLNAETAKAAKGTYNFNRNCQYTTPVSLDKGESVIDGIISAIDENSNLGTVVGGFLGIGTKTGAYPKDELDSDYALKATTLKESDLQNFTANNGTYTFTLANAKDPKKTGATPLSRFTNDFITHEEVVAGIADFTTAITVNSTKVNYDSIKVSVTVVDGKIATVKYSYNFDATLVIKAAVLTITGTGAAQTVGQYTNIKY